MDDEILVDIAKTLGQVQGTVGEIKATQKEILHHAEKTNGHVADHLERITTLEARIGGHEVNCLPMQMVQALREDQSVHAQAHAIREAEAKARQETLLTKRQGVGGLAVVSFVISIPFLDSVWAGVKSVFLIVT
jgi:hypothetical protein